MANLWLLSRSFVRAIQSQVIFTFVIVYRFEYQVGSHFVALVSIFSIAVIYFFQPSLYFDILKSLPSCLRFLCPHSSPVCCNIKLLFVLVQKALFPLHLMSLYAIWDNLFSFLVKVMTRRMVVTQWWKRGHGVLVCLRLDAHIMPSIQKFTENSNYIHSLTNLQSSFQRESKMLRKQITFSLPVATSSQGL